MSSWTFRSFELLAYMYNHYSIVYSSKPRLHQPSGDLQVLILLKKYCSLCCITAHIWYHIHRASIVYSRVAMLAIVKVYTYISQWIVPLKNRKYYCKKNLLNSMLRPKNRQQRLAYKPAEPDQPGGSHSNSRQSIGPSSRRSSREKRKWVVRWIIALCSAMPKPTGGWNNRLY